MLMGWSPLREGEPAQGVGYPKSGVSLTSGNLATAFACGSEFVTCSANADALVR